MVNCKLAFRDWFFCNLVILIKLCKIRYLNLDKTPLFPRIQVICLKNWKLWQAATTIKFNIFCLNFEHVSYSTIRHNSIISKNSGYLPEKLKTLTSCNYHKVQYFWLKFWTRFLLNNLFEMVFGIFFMLFRSWVINKNTKSECVETKSFLFLQITQDLNKIKKSQTPCCR